MARLASTSLVFMLWLTPAPAWNGSTRNASMSSACCARPVGRVAIRREAEDLVRGPHDGIGEMVRQAARGVVGARRGLLDLDRGTHERDVRAAAADGEVPDGARRLDAVVGVGGDLQLAQRIALDARLRLRSIASLVLPVRCWSRHARPGR